MRTFDNELLEAVRIGILTDDELKIALKHYRILHAMLELHGPRYELVRNDVRDKLQMLEGFTEARRKDGRII